MPPREKPKPRSYAWRAPVTASDTKYPEQVFKPRKDKLITQAQLTVNARALKITVPLDAAAVAALPAPDGLARVKLTVNCEGKSYTADIATKALRKAKSTIAANGAANVFVMVQGKLKGNEIAECGLVAQAKTAKPAGDSSAA
jgi:hypothetical protein